jgi:hypothetical protein
MTQQFQKKVTALLVGVGIIRSIYPSPIIDQKTKKLYESQWPIRIGLVISAYLAFWFGTAFTQKALRNTKQQLREVDKI